jgi:hypothetical protein
MQDVYPKKPKLRGDGPICGVESVVRWQARCLNPVSKIKNGMSEVKSKLYPSNPMPRYVHLGWSCLLMDISV